MLYIPRHIVNIETSGDFIVTVSQLFLTWCYFIFITDVSVPINASLSLNLKEKN